MLRKVLAVFLVLLLFIFLSGCIQNTEKSSVSPTGKVIDVEEKAVQEVEKEMNEILENMTMEDIEKALTE